MDRRRICRYFERGSCKKQKCPFVHLQQSRKICDYYTKGMCKKGVNCNFYHPPKQTQDEKAIRKNFKPQVEKKQWKPEPDINNQAQEEQQFEIQNMIKEQQQLANNHNSAEQKQEQKQEKQDIKIEQVDDKLRRQKQYRVRMILGLDESSQSDYEQQVVIIPEVKVKPPNFHKIYPKKFPDYTKTGEIKKKILQNQEKYFKGKKYLDFLNSLHDPAEKEYYQIIRKFQDSFQLEQEIQGSGQTEHQPRLYRIRMRPLLYNAEINFHFEMVQDFIEVQVDCRKYPQEKAKFSIMNYSIPEQYRIKLNGSLQKMHEKKSIFETLKAFMNNFQKIYQLVKSKLENEYYSQIQIEKKIERTLSKQNQRKIRIPRKRVKKTEKTDKQNPDVIVEKYGIEEKINVGNMNYDIQVQSLMINNCEYALVERILLFLQCICEKKIIHILEADRKQMKIGVKLRCKKCQITIMIALHREVMQLRSTQVGKLGLQNAKLSQVGGISWRIGCSCDQDIFKSKIYLSGQRLNTNCHECFKNMSVQFMGLKFFNPFLTFNITQGKQLPNRGACKHMKLSFRWCRYGCCGRMFSCDECHINDSVYEHDKIEGITMLCGFCSIQQPVNKQCFYCKKQLVRGVDKGGHWQGGMGCRDQTLLSKKDGKKYSGLTKKK